MTTEDIITLVAPARVVITIFCEVDDSLPEIIKHSQAKLYPSELVTIGILFALKGGHFRAFYRWLKRDYDALFAGLPERTRLQRLLKAHQDWCDLLLAEPSLFTVIDTYPIELLFPIREGRSQHQIGKKGRDKGRWRVGVKLCWLLDDHGRVAQCRTCRVRQHRRVTPSAERTGSVCALHVVMHTTSSLSAQSSKGTALGDWVLTQCVSRCSPHVTVQHWAASVSTGTGTRSTRMTSISITWQQPLSTRRLPSLISVFGLQTAIRPT